MRDVHAIDDGRKLCIPTGIVKLLSYFAKDGEVRVAFPGSVGGGRWPDSGVADEA